MRDFSDIAIAVPTTVTYTRFSDRETPWFFGRALAQLIEGAGIGKSEIDGLTASSFALAPDGPQSLLNHFDMTTPWLESVPFGGASGVIALRRAARAVQAGDANIVACIAADNNDPESFRRLVEQFSRFSSDGAYPYGAAGPNAVFALITRAYMDRYGLRRDDLGRLSVAQRENAVANTNALLRNPITIDDYLNARPIAEPLHLLDCVMPCAGAEAFLVMSTERAERLQLPYARVLGATERHNAYLEDPIAFRGGWALDRDALFDGAGIAPGDVDVVQTYDDYPALSLMQLEDLGFLEKGDGRRFLETTDLTVHGDLPHNTCGGQLSSGQAGAAGGFLGLVEAVRQLTDQCLGERVEDARIAAVAGYGMVNYDRCMCTSSALLQAHDA